jgi:hypothetical protein
MAPLYDSRDEWKARCTMGAVSGDKSRYNRERRKKLARRVSARALRATLKEQAAAAPAAKSAAKSDA